MGLGLGAITAGLNFAGGLLGSGGSKQQALPQTRQGYQTLADIPAFEREDFTTEELPQALIDVFRSERPRRPFRQMTQAEMTGPFAQKGLVDFQNYMIRQNIGGEEAAPEAGGLTPETEALVNAMFAREQLGRIGEGNPRFSSTSMGQAYNRGGQDDLAELGALMRELGAQPVTTGINRGGFATDDAARNAELYGLIDRISGVRG